MISPCSSPEGDFGHLNTFLYFILSSTLSDHFTIVPNVYNPPITPPVFLLPTALPLLLLFAWPFLFCLSHSFSYVYTDLNSLLTSLFLILSRLVTPNTAHSYLISTTSSPYYWIMSYPALSITKLWQWWLTFYNN